ncbi:hypothetical protein ACGCE5_13180 [Kluyvera ascorbata]|uniref:hypothetical protein n=1 Tax=Kluyvera ascorbata TaxID=51288 RepID=UPI003567D071
MPAATRLFFVMMDIVLILRSLLLLTHASLFSPLSGSRTAQEIFASAGSFTAAITDFFITVALIGNLTSIH